MKFKSTSLNSFSRLLQKIEIIESIEKCEQLLQKELQSQQVEILSFLNAHAVNLAMQDPVFYKNLMSSDLLLRDGIGIKIALTSIGQNPGMNMNGTDFIPRVLQVFQNQTVALLGTKDPNLSQAAKLIEEIYACKIVSRQHGFLPLEDYIQQMQTARPRVIVLAMGMPKQEMVAEALKQQINYPCLIVNGGAILDYISGHVPRAPWLFRRFGFEWLWRLLVEPRRLWRRYLVGNLVFLVRLIFFRLAYGQLRTESR